MEDSLFPETPWSLIARAANAEGDPAALIRPLLERYWQPVYESIRQGLQCSDADALLLVERFLDQLLQPQILATLDPTTTRFRDIVRSHLADFMAEQPTLIAEQVPAIKGKFNLVERVDTGTSHGSPEQIFDEQWTLLLFQRSIDQLKMAAAATPLFEVFKAHDITGERPPNAELAARLSIEVAEIEPLLFSARRQFRGFLISEVLAYSAEQDHTQAELDWLLN